MFEWYWYGWYEWYVTTNEMWMVCEWYESNTFDMIDFFCEWYWYDWDVNNIDANIAIVSTIIWYDWYNRI